MDDLWTKVEALQGETLETVDGTEFHLESVGLDHVRVVPASSGKVHKVPRREFEAAAARHAAGKSIRPAALRQAGVSAYHPAYISTILGKIFDA